MFGWRDGKVEGWKTPLFVWEEKWEDKNIVSTNLLLYPYYIKHYYNFFNYITHKYINMFISKWI